jgi:hypothetical protein
MRVSVFKNFNTKHGSAERLINFVFRTVIAEELLVGGGLPVGIGWVIGEDDDAGGAGLGKFRGDVAGERERWASVQLDGKLDRVHGGKLSFEKNLVK